MVTLSGHRDAIVGTCWSPNSEKEVITVSWDHSIIVWDLELAGIFEQKMFDRIITKKCFRSEVIAKQYKIIHIRIHIDRIR